MNNESPVLTPHIDSTFTPIWTQSTQIYRCTQQPIIDAALKHNVDVGYSMGLKTGFGVCVTGFVMGMFLVKLLHAKK